MPGRNMDVKVQCYSGYIYAEEPRSFVWQDSELRIESILRTSQEPGKRLFRVITENGKSFQLSYDEATDRWSAVELSVQ